MWENRKDRSSIFVHKHCASYTNSVFSSTTVYIIMDIVYALNGSKEMALLTVLVH